MDDLFPKDEDESWKELKTILRTRIEDAENNSPAKKTFEQVTQKIIQNRKPEK